MDEGAVRRILCEILGVGENATEEEIHAGYSEQAKKWHPDRVQHNPELAAIAEKKIKEINQAFDCLKSRAEFDKHGAKLARKTQSGLESQQVNPNKSAATKPKKAGSDGANSAKASESSSRAGKSAQTSNGASNATESENSTKSGGTSQNWHTNSSSSGQTSDIFKPAKPLNIPELRKVGTRIALWMTLIFLILAFIEDKVHNHSHLNGFQPSMPEKGVTLYPPYNPASPLPTGLQSINRPQAPANDSAAPPPGESIPQSIYGRNQNN